MKTIIFSIAIASALVLVSIFTGFPLPSHKVNDTQNKLQEAKISFSFGQSSAKEMAEKQTLLEASKTEIWECETTIENNENHILQINSKISNDGSVLEGLYENRINALKMKNYQLQKKITAIENNQSSWEQLKRELNKDVEKFGSKMYLLVFEKRN